MYALIVHEVDEDNLTEQGFETFGEEEAIYAVGTKEELEELVSSWTIKKSNGTTIYRTDKGFCVGLSYTHILRVGPEDV